MSDSCDSRIPAGVSGAARPLSTLDHTTQPNQEIRLTDGKIRHRDPHETS